MIPRDLPPLEWNPDELDPEAVALIRARFPKHPAKKKPSPIAALEEALRENLEDAA